MPGDAGPSTRGGVASSMRGDEGLSTTDVATSSKPGDSHASGEDPVESTMPDALAGHGSDAAEGRAPVGARAAVLVARSAPRSRGHPVLYGHYRPSVAPQRLFLPRWSTSVC